VPESVAAAVGHEVCWALQVAHEQGVIHRDVKPENVLLDSLGRVVLTDFGGVKAFERHGADAETISKTDIVGTTGFMAPEQQTRGSLGPYTDVFGLGVQLYNLATGKMPCAGPVLGAPGPAGRYIDPRKYRAELSDGFCAILHRCLQVKPRQRYPSAEALRQALRDILSAHGVMDARDELCQYVARPAKHASASRERTVSIHMETLMKAVGDKDEQRAAEVLAHLHALDPENRQAQRLAAGLDPSVVAAAQSRRSAAARSQRAPARPHRRRWMLPVLATALALAGAAVWGYLSHLS
jgi:serine/threonine protein kinase